jgi:hypothetical protein
VRSHLQKIISSVPSAARSGRIWAEQAIMATVGWRAMLNGRKAVR